MIRPTATKQSLATFSYKRPDDEDDIDDEEEFLLAQALAEKMPNAESDTEEQSHFSGITSRKRKGHAGSSGQTGPMLPPQAPPSKSARRTQLPSSVPVVHQPRQPMADTDETTDIAQTQTAIAIVESASPKWAGWDACKCISTLNLSSPDCELFKAPSGLKKDKSDKWAVEVAKMKAALTKLESLLTGNGKVKDQEIKADLTMLKRLATDRNDKKFGWEGKPTSFRVKCNCVKDILTACKDLRTNCMVAGCHFWISFTIFSVGRHDVGQFKA